LLDAMTAHSMDSALPPFSAPMLETKMAVDTHQTLPLVSILVRSMDRPMLAEALQSIAQQTYPHIEVILVNAKGAGHSLPATTCGQFPLRFIDAGRPLPRAAAANAALDAACGQFLLFLDDDDLLLADHIATLASVLIEGQVQAAYSGVRLIDAAGATVRLLNEPWEPKRLRGANFLPIHSVLFHAALRDAGCRFDESLDCLEDWDFWLQVSRHSEFQQVAEISALYRFSLGNSGLSAQADAQAHIKNRARIFEKWQPRFTAQQWVESFYWFESVYGHFKSVADLRWEELCVLRDHLAALRTQIAEQNQRLATLDYALAERDHRLAVLDLTLSERNQHIAALDDQVMDARATIQALVTSTSWKLTRPVRFASRLLRGQFGEAGASLRREFHHLGRAFYWRLPARYRDRWLHWGYRWAGPLFHGLGHYELWRWRRPGAMGKPLEASAGLIDLAQVTPLMTPPGSIAVHIHLFYPDLATEFAEQLKAMPFDYDLFVSVADATAQAAGERAFRGLPHLQSCTVAITPNRGRDLAPMLCQFGRALLNYDFICHVHTKKSLYNGGTTQGWREYLLNGLFGNATQIRRIFALLTGPEEVGLVYPQTFVNLIYVAHTWLASQPLGQIWCQRLGITPVPTGYFDFPAGSMFWARTAALRPLFEGGITLEDFPVETGQTDGTFAHCLERLLGVVVHAGGFRIGILPDQATPSWSPWRFDQYLARRRDSVHEQLANPAVRLIVVDIFDTLLTRPLLDAEDLKTIIARRAGADLGPMYAMHRVTAEQRARVKAGRDVDLTAIFAELAALSDLSAAQIAELQHLEERIEQNAVRARADAVALLRHAITLGKRVVLASDMYLPRAILEAMLSTHDIRGWQALYVSSEIGLRKDSGELYTYLLQQEKVTAAEMLVIGDNERSDVQIPADSGARCCHVLRPVALARALPRFGPLLEQQLNTRTTRESNGDDLNGDLTLGLIVQRYFDPVFYPAFDHTLLVPAGTAESIGYAVLGPLVLAFVQWLIAQTAINGTDHLYFLSREGEFLMTVYLRWRAIAPKAPPASYLVLSRRAMTVATLQNWEDIQPIAQVKNFPSPVRDLLYERYGLALTDTDIEELTRQGVWPSGGRVEVRNGDIAALQGLLQTLMPRLLAQAKNERPGLLAYLTSMGLTAHSRCAVVDIGYSGTIQAHLNRILHHPIHGYYLITDSGAEQVRANYGVIAQGCYEQDVDRSRPVPPLMRDSFILEKLLSADTAQVVRYRLDQDGVAIPEFRPLSAPEVQTRETRAALRRGAMLFVEDAIAAREKLLPDFQVPVAVAGRLFEAFMTHPATVEERILQTLVLDDYYFGRGLVS
jgi:FMN phosphatase YigB (HAD superfamily)/glycosyltransferase involved in cell wall biosynthesis